ncbi:hypothetical protein [Treponema primitia]|uniref:hypothetical protein n=1 Tax=Treponema primitia TaxID=88058 RepID=UPI0002E079AC|nr:hypothetical protein [Treponema primitia]
MNKLFLKISDFLLFFMGIVFILAGIVTFGRSSVKQSPYPFSHYSESYSAVEKIEGIFK